jgi:hypothetical protein
MAENCRGRLPRQKNAVLWRRPREIAAAVVALTCACVSPTPRDPRDTVDAASSGLRDTTALPFDTVGAGRGVPPNQFEYSPAGKWLAGDTTVWAHLTVFPVMRRGDDPAHIEVRAMGRDTSASMLRETPLRFAECPFELRLHTDARRERARVWNSVRAPRAIACPRRQPPRFGHEQWSVWPLSSILGDSLPARLYYFDLTVRLADGRTLEYDHESAYLTLDTTSATRDQSALRFASGSEVAGEAPRQLRAWTVITNTGARPFMLEHGACALQIRLWRNPARTGMPVWRSEARQPPRRKGEQPTFYACTLELIVGTLRPNDTATFELHVPLIEVLADSLAEGRYSVGVELELVNDSLHGPARDARHSFPAGEVTLRRAPDPTPSVRSHGPLRVEAATRLVRGAAPAADSVRTFVLVTNTAIEPREVVVVRENPVTVYAFRSAVERDSFPIPTPAYTIRGARYHIAHRFTLGPGRKWLFENGVSARHLVASIGPGRYYFLAWLMGEPSSMLSAGDVEVK